LHRFLFWFELGGYGIIDLKGDRRFNREKIPLLFFPKSQNDDKWNMPHDRPIRQILFFIYLSGLAGFGKYDG